MKLHPDKSASQLLTAHGPGWVAINHERIETSVVLGSRGERFDWQCESFEALSPAHFERIAAIGPELVIFGSGTRLRFAPAPWLLALLARRTGIETMDTPAACRTYNVLASEGRHVIAALLVEPAPQGAVAFKTVTE